MIDELRKECNKMLTNLHGRYNGRSQFYKYMPKDVNYNYIQVANELIQILEVELLECVSTDLLLYNYYSSSLIKLEDMLSC